MRWMQEIFTRPFAAYRAMREAPPLSRLQFAVALLALFWGLPIFIMAIVFWDPVSSYLMKDSRAAWAGAIGSMAAAWAAVWAATHPQKIRQQEERFDGATEIIRNQSLIAQLRDDLFGISSGAKTRAEKWMQAHRAQARAFQAIFEKLCSEFQAAPQENRDIYLTEIMPHVANIEAHSGESAEALAYRHADSELQEANKSLEVTISEMQHARLQLQSINAQVIRRFNLKMATHIFRAENQLRMAEDLAAKPPMIDMLKTAVDGVIADLDAFNLGIEAAQVFLARAGQSGR